MVLWNMKAPIKEMKAAKKDMKAANKEIPSVASIKAL